MGRKLKIFVFAGIMIVVLFMNFSCFLANEGSAIVNYNFNETIVPAVVVNGCAYISEEYISCFEGIEFSNEGDGNITIMRCEVNVKSDINPSEGETVDLSVNIRVGSDKAYINGEEADCSNPPYKENGKVYIPLRYTFENLDCRVIWNNVYKIVFVDNYELVREKTKDLSKDL